MSAKTILDRYVQKGFCSKVPKDELRQHLAGVASRDRLQITDNELDEVVFLATGEKPNKGRKRRKTKITGDNTTQTDLKEFGKS